MSFSFLIVDDERLSRNYIRDLVLEFEPTANILEAKSAKIARPILESGSVDILFLDVRMSEMNGFELLNSISHRNFELVFITAFSEYAIKAIREGACDYLLKPIKKIDFKETLDRAIKKRKVALEKNGVNEFSAGNYLSHKLTLNHQQGLKLVTLKDIIYLKADNTYTIIFLSNGEKITTSKPIYKFEQMLHAPWFFRIHKSYIINTAHFKEYISKDGGIALMHNGDKLFISRYRLNEFLELIKNISGELKL